MKSIIITCVAGIGWIALLFSSVFADRWMDIAYDIQNHIPADKITPAVEEQIQARLQYIEEHDAADVALLAQQDKQSLIALMENMRNIAAYYKQKNTPKPVLSYILSRSNDIYAMTEDDVAPAGPMTTYILLSTYYQDLEARYRVHLDRDTQPVIKQETTAMNYIPEWVTTPEPAPSDTHQSIVVDISDQRLYAFENGELVYTTPITSGKRGFSTVQGDFSVKSKKTNVTLNSPFKNITYKLHVDYWIQFHGKYGIHDACNSRSCWRKEFGGQDYLTKGSHGCVNTPYEAMAWVYEWVEPGTAVRVQA